MALKEHISKFVKELLKKHQIIVKKKVTLKKEEKFLNKEKEQTYKMSRLMFKKEYLLMI